MKVVVVDYGSGNLRSAAKAFEKAAQMSGVACEVAVSSDPDRVAAADRVVLPGVGAFADCMQGLDGVAGMRDALSQAVTAKGRPFFGICVGMQLMASHGLEFGQTPGLGWIEGEVAAMTPDDPGLKIPHMGWNDLSFPAPRHPLFADMADPAYVYFVHSFAMRRVASAAVLARSDYGGPVIAAIGRDNLFGTQFHPEKSQASGLKLIANFLAWRP